MGLKIPTVWLASLCSRLHNCAAFVAVELLRHVPYSSAVMASKSLFQHNPHLRNAQEYQRALRASVLSSIAIEGVRKAAERALTPLIFSCSKKRITFRQIRSQN